MICPHQFRTSDRGKFLCGLGWFGGHPWLGNCKECITAGRNTPEAKKLFDAKTELAHPSSRKRISGCCDRADQA
jgi:hypothetical protein